MREWGSAAHAMFWVHLVSTPLIWATGIYMLVQQWDLTNAWLDISMIVMLSLSISGMWISGRRLRLIHAGAQHVMDQAIPPALLRQIQDPVLNTLVHVIIGLALGIAYLMFMKPDLVQSIIVIAIGGVVGVLAAQVTVWFERRLARGRGVASQTQPGRLSSSVK